MSVLLEKIQERGGQLSKSAQKLFSSSEGTPEKGMGLKGSGPATPWRIGLREEAPADRRRGEDRSRELRRETRPAQDAAESDQLQKRLLELEGDALSGRKPCLRRVSFCRSTGKTGSLQKLWPIRARDLRSK